MSGALSLQNTAAWQTEERSKQLQVGPGPDQNQPASDEVVIKVSHVAINPSEWKIQEHPYVPLQYPHVLGSDVAGEVALVGDAVTRFSPGGRVIGHCLGLIYGGARRGSFQTYTTCREAVVAKVPDSLSFADAVFLPLGLSTDMTGLFEILQLELPSITTKALGKMVVIWAGSSPMGSTAIQLAAAAGYTVISTASPCSHAYVRALGATEVFDHTATDVIDKIVRCLSTARFAGSFDCIGEATTTKACAEIVNRMRGSALPTALQPPNDLPANVKAVMAVGETEPKVIPGGLGVIQEAMELQKKGVSAQKIAVEL